MVIMRPTSIVVAGAGSSASVRAAGGVEFASATSLSLNGVFTSDYDDYMISLLFTSSSSNAELFMRLRASGSDNSTGSSYVFQTLTAVSTTITGQRTTSDRGRFGNIGNTQRSGYAVYMYGPNLAQPTAFRSVTAFDLSSATIVDYANTHNQSTAYDGFTLIPNPSNDITGVVTVYGLAQ